jgi:hypothetical protein
MKKIDLGQTINTLANAGVIAGIIFLGLEIRQNTETQQLSAAQQVLGLGYSNLVTLAADPRYNEILLAVNTGRELTPFEKNQAYQYTTAILTALWQGHFQYENGFLDQEIFDAFERRAARITRAPFFAEYWEQNRSFFGESFQDFLDGVIEDSVTE